MSVTIVGGRRKLNQNRNYSKSYIWTSFFENSISDIKNISYLSRRSIRSHKKSLYLNIKQYDKKNKEKTNKLSMGPFKRYVTCIMAFFNLLNYL